MCQRFWNSRVMILKYCIRALHFFWLECYEMVNCLETNQSSWYVWFLATYFYQYLAFIKNHSKQRLNLNVKSSKPWIENLKINPLKVRDYDFADIGFTDFRRKPIIVCLTLEDTNIVQYFNNNKMIFFWALQFYNSTTLLFF